MHPNVFVSILVLARKDEYVCASNFDFYCIVQRFDSKRNGKLKRPFSAPSPFQNFHPLSCMSISKGPLFKRITQPQECSAASFALMRINRLEMQVHTEQRPCVSTLRRRNGAKWKAAYATISAYKDLPKPRPVTRRFPIVATNKTTYLPHGAVQGTSWRSQRLIDFVHPCDESIHQSSYLISCRSDRKFFLRPS